MKMCLFFLLTIIAFTGYAKQNTSDSKDYLDFYPLNNGDYRDYEQIQNNCNVLLNSSTYFYCREVVKDTLLSNGELYKKSRSKKLSSTIYPSSYYYQYERLDSLTGKVFSFSFYDNTDKLVFDLSLTNGDTMVIDDYNKYYVSESVENIFGADRHIKTFYGLTLDMATNYTLVKDIGLYKTEYINSFNISTNSQTVVYANIDSTVFGLLKNRNYEICSGAFIYPIYWQADTVFTGGLYVYDDLTISPGTIVKISDTGKIIVGNGNITANGTLQNKIRFQSYNNTMWEGFKYYSGTTAQSQFSYCSFEDSQNSNNGGLFSVAKGNKISLTNCLISNSKTLTNGGAIYADSSDLRIVDCLFNSNVAKNGGAIYAKNCSPTIINSTFVNNSADSCGGVVFLQNSDANVYNSIFWNNQAVSGKEFYLNDYNSDPNFYYNDIENNVTGFSGNGSGGNFDGMFINNLSADPQFSASGDYTLSLTSPCANMGMQDCSELDLPAHDFYGNTRIYANRVDIGAFESMSTDLSCNTDKISPELFLNYPNPFNPETTIRFNTINSGNVLIKIYNIKGELVSTLVNDNLKAGSHQISFNGTNLTSGIYFCKLQTAEYSKIIKMNLIK